jgi:hypothetical protein
MKIITATTDQSVRFTAFDSDGAAVTLTSASAALAVYYQRWIKGVRLSETEVTPITDLASVGAAHSDGGLIHDADGSHRLDLPDAAFATGTDEVRLRITATDITGGIAHERFTVGAETASQASVDAVAAKTALIGTAGVTFEAPVDEDAVVTVRRARDYANTDGRALEWTNADGTWPDLTGATFVVLVARPNKSTALYSFSGSVVTPTGAGQKVQLELTDEQLAITADDYVYEGKATLASGNVVDLSGVSGPFGVLLGRDEPA